MYHIGGCLPSSAPSYVARQADEELDRALGEGEFCYLLNCRQMGKSSLRARASRRLIDGGIACGSVDLSGIGGDRITPQQWYAEILHALVRRFRLQKHIDVRCWLTDRLSRSPLAGLSEFFKEVLLELTQRKTVIFIDEIDVTLSLPFNTDDFFSLIRSCYEIDGLAFVLLGVATPGELIAEKTRTPFNVGCAVQLHGFQLHEAQPLAEGLRDRVDSPEKAIQEVLTWTGGQPFLTQKACHLLLEASMEAGKLADRAIPSLLESHLIDNWMVKDEPPHLRTIRDRLLRHGDRAGRLLGLYRQILECGAIAVDDSPEQIELQLSGLVVKKAEQLQVYNRIYERVFDRPWVEKQLENLRPYAASFTAWMGSDRRDPSRLLRGQSLEDALAWSRDKSLSNLDYQFLTASQELNQQEVRMQLELARSREIEARLIQEQKTSRVQRFLLGVTSTALLAISGLGIAAFLQYRQAVIHEVKASAQSSEALFANQQQLEALITALEAQQKLGGLLWGNKTAKMQVENALRRSAYGIVESNRFLGHEDMVYDVAFSPDGEILASGSRDRTVRLWGKDGTAIATLSGHQDFIINANFAPDGQTIASASADGTVKLWSRDGTLLRTLEHGVPVGNAIFSPDGQTIATASTDGAIRLWNLAGVQQKQIPVHPENIEAIAFSPDGKNLISGDEAGIIRFWTLTGKEIKRWQGHSAFIREIAFSPDGTKIASLSPEENLKIWTAEGTLLASIANPEAPMRAIAFSPDGQTLASVDLAGTLKLRTLTGDILNEIESNGGWLWSVAFSPDGQTLAAASRDRAVKLWQPEQRLLRVLPEHQNAVLRVAIAPDDDRLATTGLDGTVRIWSRDGRLLQTLAGDRFFPGDLKFSPDGTLLVSGGRDGRIKLWDRQGRDVQTIQAHENTIRAIAFAPDGQSFASASWDGTVKLWRRDGELLQTFRNESSGASTVVFAPDGKTAIAGYRDGTIREWQLNGTVLRTFSAHGREVYEILPTPEGKTLISAARDGTIKRWQDDGTLLATMEHQRAVGGIALSPDNRTIAAVDEGGTVKLWGLDGTLRFSLRGHEDAVNSVEFTADGKFLVSVGADRMVILWELERILDIDALLDFSCSWLQDYLRTHPEIADRHLCD